MESSGSKCIGPTNSQYDAYAPSMMNAPCAMLITFMMPHTSEKPSAQAA